VVVGLPTLQSALRTIFFMFGILFTLVLVACFLLVVTEAFRWAGVVDAVFSCGWFVGKRNASQDGQSLKSPWLSFTLRLFTLRGQRPSGGMPSHRGIVHSKDDQRNSSKSNVPQSAVTV